MPSSRSWRRLKPPPTTDETWTPFLVRNVGPMKMCPSAPAMMALGSPNTRHTVAGLLAEAEASAYWWISDFGLRMSARPPGSRDGCPTISAGRRVCVCGARVSRAGRVGVDEAGSASVPARSAKVAGSAIG